MKLSVIISCYAAESMISSCLTSLQNQTHKDLEIIVIDANSPDNTRQIIKDNFPEVILLEEERIGVGAALNLGLKIASGDIIVIDFNTDEYAETDWAEELLKAHASYEDKVVISPTRIGSNKLVDGYGSKFTKSGGLIRIGFGSEHDPNREPEEVDCTGINTFPRQLIEEIGLIDEDYEFYGADTDYSLRARLAGYKIMTAPKAVTHHQLSASKALDYRKYMQRMNFGILRVVFLHGSKKVIFRSLYYYSIHFNVRAFARMIIHLLRKNENYRNSANEIIGRIKGVFHVIRNLKQIRVKRKEYKPKLIF
ncbi:MAG: glycosyltransferase family 2 protein [Candidatus Heimdallarchaeota archaeon]|nr:glycosyltransferase family 2 protein [Candidatus Heimdallarchaeota archaeon]